MKKTLLSIFSLIVLIVLVGCGKGVDNDYNALVDDFGIGEGKSLLKLSIKKETANLEVKYYSVEQSGLLGMNLEAKENTETMKGEINTSKKTIEFPDDNLKMTYKIKDNTMVLLYADTDKSLTFDTKGSDAYDSNISKFEAQEEELISLNLYDEDDEEVEEELYAEEEVEEVTVAANDSDREERAELLTEKISKDLKEKIVGNWKYNDFSDSWTGGVEIEFKEDGTVTMLEKMSVPESLAFDLNYTGTYTIDRGDLKNSLMVISENKGAWDEPVDLASLDNYDSYYQVGKEKNKDVFITVNFDLDVSGTKLGDSVSEKISADMSISHHNSSIQVNENNVFNNVRDAYEFTEVQG